MKITTKSWYSTRHNKRVHRIGIEGTSRNLMFNDDDLREVKSWEVVYLPSAETMRVTPDQGPSRA